MRQLRWITSNSPMSEGTRRRAASETHRSPIQHLASGAAGAARRGGLPLTAVPLPGRRARVRRDLPDAARRRRSHLGGAHARASAASVRPSTSREPDVVIGTRRSDLDRAARGPALRARRVLAAPPLRARRPRPRARLRGPVPPAGRPSPAAAGHRRRRSRARPSARLDRRRRRRARDLPPRPGLEQGVVFRDRLGADAGPHRPRDRPARASAAPPSSARAAYDAPYFARAVLGYMDAIGIERAHLVGNSMGGRVRWRRRWPIRDRALTVSLLSPALAFRKRRELVPLVRLAAPRARRHPAPDARSPRPRLSSGACSRAPSASTRRPQTWPRTSSAAPIARARRGSPSSPRCATSTSTHPTGGTVCGRALAELGRRPCSSGAIATGSFPPPSPATWPMPLPAARSGGPPRVRPCSPGRAGRPHERARPRPHRRQPPRAQSRRAA